MKIIKRIFFLLIAIAFASCSSNSFVQRKYTDGRYIAKNGHAPKAQKIESEEVVVKSPEVNNENEIALASNNSNSSEAPIYIAEESFKEIAKRIVESQKELNSLEVIAPVKKENKGRVKPMPTLVGDSETIRGTISFLLILISLALSLFPKIIAVSLPFMLVSLIFLLLSFIKWDDEKGMSKFFAVLSTIFFLLVAYNLIYSAVTL